MKETVWNRIKTIFKVTSKILVRITHKLQ